MGAAGLQTQHRVLDEKRFTVMEKARGVGGWICRGQGGSEEGGGLKANSQLLV